MITLSRFRQIEFWFITSLALLFLIILIADNYSHYAQILVRIDRLEEDRIFLRYNWWQNGCWPLISVFLTTYGCWYVLNNVIFPRFWPQKPFHLLAFWGLLGVFLMTGIWNYLYFSKELALRQDSNYHTIGAKVVSNYRLLYVVVKTVAFFAILSVYTILSQMYQWTLQLSNDQKSPQTKVMEEGSWLAILGFWVVLAFGFLRNNGGQAVLLLWIQGAFIHAYLFHNQLIEWPFRTKRTDLRPKQIFVLVVSLVSSFGALIFSQFFNILNGYRRIYYFLYSVRADDLFAFWSISLAGAVVVTIVRQLLIKPLEVNLSRNQAELSALRAQINPHFLFNAMNTLYATAIEEKAEKTSLGIQQLADMMRFMMHENNQDQIDIRQEVQYLRNYIDLQRLRISESDKFELKIDLDDSLCLKSVAPMMMIPFVENAFKHGISLRNQSWIFIKLNCDNESLHFKVHNSLHPRHDQDPEKHSSGIGLVNVKKRLELLYPHTHQLLIHQTEKEFSVHLVIDFRGKRKRKKLDSVLVKYDEMT
ncbi:histidine kinase [Runella sp. MFBS21]|uniref:sensor histidine kinase n=1 Tax=Runella sp. MFBS21 TaxID=3034018 RepID=UPI0023F948AC|nr:histidine kinase [Runella sp. MFBS21]MDF7820571.1 histidine kinase [Runella sp. MFBS21]